MNSCKRREGFGLPYRRHRVAMRTMLSAATLTLMGASLIPASAFAVTDSTEQGATPVDKADMAGPFPEQPVVTAPVPPEKRMPFFDDAKVSAQARTYYLDRDNYDDSKNEAWAIGGSATFLSGYAANLVRVGAVAYTSQPVYAPDDRDGTLLLKPDQEGYTVLGQLYGEFKLTDQLAGAIGRKEYNTPYINKNDTRMTPNTFQGVALYGNAGGKDGAAAWRYGGGYISKIKERNSDEFVWMSKDAGASVDRGVYAAGVNYNQGDLNVGAFQYYSRDIIDIFYTEAIYAMKSAGTPLKLSAQYTNQSSTGDNLLTGSQFSANQWGVKGDLALGDAVLTLAYTTTGDGSNMRNPWSGYPGYTSVQVKDFNRAGESAIMLKAGYDLSKVWKGGSAYALWVHGSGVDSPNYNEDEVDLNLQWTPDKATALRGMSFRVRYAHITQDGGGDPSIDDFRIIVNYDFPRP